MNQSKKNVVKRKKERNIHDFLNDYQSDDNKKNEEHTPPSFIRQTPADNITKKQEPIETKLWVDKYKPKLSEDILGNYKNVLWIERWLDNFRNKKSGTKKAALVSGPPGIGKTSSVKILLESKNYDILEINASMCRNKKYIQEQLSEASSTSKIRFDSKGNFIKQHVAIIMDEVDGMTSGDSGGITELIKLLNPLKGVATAKKSDKEARDNKWNAPIICICNDRYCPKISELAKECEDIKFQKPANDRLKVKALEILELENISGVNDLIMTKLISFSDGDIRKLINMLQFTFGTKDKSVDKVNVSTKYEDIVKTKDHQLFDITKKIITMGDNFNYSVISNFAESDLSLVPLMIGENYIEYVSSGGKYKGTKILADITESLSLADVINKYMFTDMNFQVSEYYIFNSCIYPAYRIKGIVIV